jgi:4-hydroxy-2-oxoglutarate aldolase
MPQGRPMLVGTGRESTRATIAATRRAAAAGADAVLVRTPSFFKAQMTGDVLERHYREVADARPVPVLLYNVTMFTGVQPAGRCRGAPGRAPQHRRHEGIGQRLSQIADYVSRTPDDFTVLGRVGHHLFHALCAGCDGGIPGAGGALSGGVRPPSGM